MVTPAEGSTTVSLEKKEEGAVQRPSSLTFGWPGWLAGLEPFRGMFDEIRVEEFTEAGELVIRAEVPGVDPDKDVTITVDRGRLIMAVERREVKELRDTAKFRSEFRYGSFSRTITLPPGTDEQDIKATYADGILTVRLPFAEPETARTIPVTKV